MIKKIILLIMLLLSITTILSCSNNVVSAKRLAPAEVAPIRYKGVEYRVVNFGFENGGKKNGGYVVAVRLSDKKKLWGKHIYQVKHETGLERDVQDVFIVSMTLLKKKNCLKIVNENQETFLVKLSNAHIEKVQ